ncbi:helix-turn-helix transcriptional regulator [Goodfellowiella coeruleoviolacea]|uniref:Helix-turn-helix domain-containing protein n=1 Tax=Goodfellowiella coeruleoviolacea TaxID=334858 RepID=A0AAE3GH01_9PSEU|nr:helix-turn-helix transcriptional regulator [Goodfellowiella coeruleoviolacea]MCP2167538.1 Helix-turn-helix domain-containing protein [Goodfellowiella coeruleoviolacea]
MQQRPELGEFLRSRRARVRPDDIGLATYGGRRRVPGLRREELAQLAGISVGYYTRLEQGQSPNASDAVLAAIARVLRLDEAERAHLHALARPAPRARRRVAPERLRPAVQLMIDSLTDVPALVLGRRTDVLAWNPLAHALLAGHLDRDSVRHPHTRPNWARLFFLDPHLRELVTDWPGKARDTVADLRLIAGRHPDDPRLAELVGELTMRSAEFAALWSAHPVRRCARHTREYRHPVVGPLTLNDELLTLPDDEGQRLVVFTVAPGSASQAALRLLADLVADAQPAPTPRAAPAPR